MAERLKMVVLIAAVAALICTQLPGLASIIISAGLAVLLIIYLAVSAPKLTEAKRREREYVVKQMDSSLAAGGLKWRIDCQESPYNGFGRLCWIKEPLCPDCGQPMVEEGVVHASLKCYECHPEGTQEFLHPDSRRIQAKKALAVKIRELRRQFRQSGEKPIT